MKRYRLYKHELNQDVAMEILSFFYLPEEDSYKVRIRWWNIGKSHDPWCMNLIEKFTIPKTNFETNWKEYT